jgi:aryl-alcohol dehydrogenase-like predicted oxidoreductase
MSMRYKLLGRTGLRVSELCLGAMIFGDRRGGWGASKDEAARLGEFAEAGGNFIDTANSYARGESERIVGELIAPERERWVLSTKYTLTMRPDDPNGGGAHRKSLVQSLEASLRRLGTGYLDLYWVHIWDAFTPVDEVVRALDDMVSAGKVLYVGISDAERAHLEEVSRIQLAFPHDFGADRLAYGTTRPLIDSHRHPTAHT